MSMNYGSIETADFDTSEFISARVALSLDKLGIAITASEWGDTEQEVFYIRQELGEIPAERHPPNRTVILKLQLKEDKPNKVKLAEAAFKLQQKVGVLQREGGWVRRTFSSRNGARVAVGFEVYSAVLAGIQGWVLGHRNVANEVTLTLTCSPYCYGTEEVEGTTVTSSNGRDVEWEIANAGGSAPGRLRLKVKNVGTIDWLSMIGSIESRDRFGGARALFAYKCNELTVLGTSLSETEKAGASGKVLSAGTLSAVGYAVMSFKIKASNDMQHVGGRRVLMRVFNQAASSQGNRMQLEWRGLNGEWQTNDEVEVKILGGWQIIDLGEVILDRAMYGEQAWEGRLVLRNAKNEVTTAMYFDKVYVLAQEQYFKLRKALSFRTPIVNIIAGLPTSGALGEALNGKTMATGGGTWATSGAATDWLIGSKTLYSNWFKRESKANDTEARTALVSAPTVANGMVRVVFNIGELVASGNPGPEVIHRFGVVMHGGSIKVQFEMMRLGIGPPTYIVSISGAHVAETKILEGFTAWNYFQTSYEETGFKTAQILEPVRVVCVGSKVLLFIGDLSTVPLLTADLTSEVAGKVGVFAQNISNHLPEAGETRKIGVEAFSVTEAEYESLVHTTRLMNISTDGVFRQAAAVERWGELPLHEGFLPYVAPSGLEARPLRGILIPSQGDYEQYSDAGENKLEVTPYHRPAFHFMSEAS